MMRAAPLCFAVVLLGCADHPPGPAPERVYVDYELPNVLYPVPTGDVASADWANALARGECSRAERCRMLPSDGLMSNEPCQQYLERSFEDQLGPKQEALLSDPGWDAAAFGACVTARAMRSCDVGPARSLESIVACVDSAYYATSLQGDSCRDSASCKNRGYCESSRGNEPGVCALIGNACRSAAECAKGTYCGHFEGICLKQIAAGDSCSYPYDFDSCAGGLPCELVGGDHGGICGGAGRRAARQPSLVPPQLEVVKLGATCDRQKNICEPGLACVSRDSEPSRCIAMGKEGEPCDGRRTQPCAAELYCQLTEPSKGTCQPPLAVSMACTPSDRSPSPDLGDPPPCVRGAMCSEETSTCVPYVHARLGESCIDNCYSSVCTGALPVCVPLL